MKRVLTTLSLVITLFSINFDSNAGITIAIADGNWNSPFIWSNGVPSCGDTIVIPDGYRVTITETVNLDNSTNPLCAVVQINIDGALRFGNGKKLNLAAGACVSVGNAGSIGPSSKGGGASESIYIDEDRLWQASDGLLNGPSSLGCAIVLPVELISFESKIQNSDIIFEWHVMSQIHVNFYEVLFSYDGKEWNTLFTKRANHSINNSIQYQELIQNKLQNNTVYFKLKNVDFDGKTKVLALTSIDNSKQIKDLIITPNPVLKNQSFEIQSSLNLEDKFDIEILNQFGKVVFKKVINSDSSLKIETEKLNSGTYFVIISNDKEIQKSKFFVI